MLVKVYGSAVFGIEATTITVEVNIDKGSNNYPSRSIEYLPYPTARTFSVGINFSL